MSITANVANGNFMLVQFPVEGLDHFTTTLLVERGNSKAYHLAIIVWIDTQVRSLNAFLDIGQQLTVPGLNYLQTRFRNRNRADLVDGCRCTIVIDLYAFHKRRQ